MKQKLGMLSVIQKVHEIDGSVKWLCRCECGKLLHMKPRQLQGLIGEATGRVGCGCKREAKGLLSREERSKIQRKNSKSGRRGALSSDKHPYNRFFTIYKYSAKQRGRECSLTYAQAEALFLGDCYYCGRPPMDKTFTRNDITQTLKQNGIDRKDNDKGYTVDNSVSCCQWCNVAKSALAIGDFLDLARRIAARHPGPTEDPAPNLPIYLGIHSKPA